MKTDHPGEPGHDSPDSPSEAVTNRPRKRRNLSMLILASVAVLAIAILSIRGFALTKHASGTDKDEKASWSGRMTATPRARKEARKGRRARRTAVRRHRRST